MELTGKAQKDFWKWYLKPEQKKEYKTEALYGGDNTVKLHFVSQSFAERYGVYIDWLYSIGGAIVPYISSNDYGHVIALKDGYYCEVSHHEIPDHKERRKYTISKLDEMYNDGLPLY